MMLSDSATPHSGSAPGSSFSGIACLRYRATSSCTESELAAAEKDLNRALEVAEDTPARYAGLTNRGALNVHRKRWRHAARDLQQAIRLSPRDPYVSVWYYRIGLVHLLQARTDEAILWLEKSAATHTGLASVHAGLASSYA